MMISELEDCIAFTEKQCALAHRRVLLDEEIPQDDKVFSYFEPHTELINCGKTPYPIEFGHRILIVQDRAGFIIKFFIIDHTTYDKVLIPEMKKLQEYYEGKIKSACFDKGYWSPQNWSELEKIVTLACLPKKGNRNKEESEWEGASEFEKAHKWHAGIESAIHALGSGNGLALCSDKKEKGYKRYVALGVMGRNLQVLGIILLKRLKKKQKQKAKAAQQRPF